MKKPLQYLTATALALTAMVFAPALLAKEIEIEIAGPLAYVADLDDPQHYVVVIAPVGNHRMHVISGGNAYLWNDSHAHFINLFPGFHTLDFKTTCTQSTSSKVNLYDVSQSDTKTRIMASGTRFAVRIPKPCEYHGVQTSRVKLDVNAIKDSTLETPYTTWMALRYTVDDSTDAATLTMKPDTGHPSTKTVKFVQSGSHDRPAASMVLGIPDEVPKYECDQQSADFFDMGNDFWGLSRKLRLFPGVDDQLLQNSDYNYDTSRCPQVASATPAMRMKVKKGTYPGRADCHAPQSNINGLVVNSPLN